MIIIANSFADSGTRPCFTKSNVYLSSLRFILFPAQLSRCAALRHIAKEYQSQIYCNVRLVSKREIYLFSDFYRLSVKGEITFKLFPKMSKVYYMTLSSILYEIISSRFVTKCNLQKLLSKIVSFDRILIIILSFLY